MPVSGKPVRKTDVVVYVTTESYTVGDNYPLRLEPIVTK